MQACKINEKPRKCDVSIIVLKFLVVTFLDDLCVHKVSSICFWSFWFCPIFLPSCFQKMLLATQLLLNLGMALHFMHLPYEFDVFVVPKILWNSNVQGCLIFANENFMVTLWGSGNFSRVVLSTLSLRVQFNLVETKLAKFYFWNDATHHYEMTKLLHAIMILK